MKTSEWTSNLIAALALVVAVVTAFMGKQAIEYQDHAIKVQEQALATAEAQWQESGAIFSLEAMTWHLDPETMEVIRPQLIFGDEAFPPSHGSGMYVFFEVINHGRSVGGIKDVGYYASTNERVSLGSTGYECMSDDDWNDWNDCLLPQKVDPATAETVRVIWHDAKQVLCGNDHLRQGVQFYVQSTRGRIYDATERWKIGRPENC